MGDICFHPTQSDVRYGGRFGRFTKKRRFEMERPKLRFVGDFDLFFGIFTVVGTLLSGLTSAGNGDVRRLADYFFTGSGLGKPKKKNN